MSMRLLNTLSFDWIVFFLHWNYNVNIFGQAENGVHFTQQKNTFKSLCFSQWEENCAYIFVHLFPSALPVESCTSKTKTKRKQQDC